MTAISLLEAARKYTAVGISVLPISAGTKLPDASALAATGNLNFPRRPSWQAFTQRLATDHELGLWFAANSRNLGIVTGYGHLLILDFDTPGSFESWRERYGRMARKTGIQKTPRGVHALFRWKGSWKIHLYTHNGFRFLGSDRDRIGEMKGFRDYVVAWPSIHPSGAQYYWLPGQAPWETEIAVIEDLAEIGIAPVSELVKGYVSSVSRLIAHPRQRLPALLRHIGIRYRYLAGVFFRK